MNDDPVGELQRRVRAIQHQLDEAHVATQSVGEDPLGRSAFAAVLALADVVADLLALVEPAEPA